MSIFPPEQRIWWKEPVERAEVLWVSIAFIWCLIMFLMMPYWHMTGNQNLANTAFRTTPERYAAKAEEMVAKYKVREEGTNAVPVVHPPPGSDVYLIGRLWEWWPILELEKGKEYKLHLSSMDWLHGFSLQPTNINIQVHPGYDMAIRITPTTSGEHAIVCNEFCGVGHHAMLGKIYVK